MSSPSAKRLAKLRESKKRDAEDKSKEGTKKKKGQPRRVQVRWMRTNAPTVLLYNFRVEENDDAFVPMVRKAVDTGDPAWLSREPVGFFAHGAWKHPEDKDEEGNYDFYRNSGGLKDKKGKHLPLMLYGKMILEDQIGWSDEEWYEFNVALCKQLTREAKRDFNKDQRYYRYEPHVFWCNRECNITGALPLKPVDYYITTAVTKLRFVNRLYDEEDIESGQWLSRHPEDADYFFQEGDRWSFQDLGIPESFRWSGHPERAGYDDEEQRD